MTETPGDEKLAFEEAFAQLEEIVAQMESGERTLDELIALYERGQALVRLCGARLDEADLRIQRLREDGTLEPLD